MSDEIQELEQAEPEVVDALLEHRRELLKIKICAGFAAVPVSVLVVLIGLSVYGTVTGKWHMKPDDWILQCLGTALTAIFSAAGGALAIHQLSKLKEEEKK